MIYNYIDLGNENYSNALFVFDDVWDKDHIQHFNFAKKSVTTSRFLFPNLGIYNRIISPVCQYRSL